MRRAPYCRHRSGGTHRRTARYSAPNTVYPYSNRYRPCRFDVVAIDSEGRTQRLVVYPHAFIR